MRDMAFVLVIAVIGAATGISALIIGFLEQNERHKLNDRVTELEHKL